MHSRIIYNNRLTEVSKSRTGAGSPSSLYGRGVFTTLAIHNHRPFLWSEHWNRLEDHASRVGVDISEYEEAGVRNLLDRLIEANHVRDGRARVTMLGSEERGPWAIKKPGALKAELVIMTGDPHSVTEDGISLTVSPYRANTLSPLIGIKSVNYLDHVLAREEARARDFDEAVTLNERGEIVSATMANIFWVTEGKIHTPVLSTGALAGTTRGRIIELASELSIPLVEGVYELSDLGDADEIFLTSAGHGVAIVTTFDFHRYAVPVGSVAVLLREALRQLTLRAE